MLELSSTCYTVERRVGSGHAGRAILWLADVKCVVSAAAPARRRRGGCDVSAGAHGANTACEGCSAVCYNIC